MSQARKRLGLRREVVFFVPTAVLLLVVIAAFNLSVYRNAVGDLEAERLSTATALAMRAAAELSTGPPPSAERVWHLAPLASAVAVHRADDVRTSRVGAPLVLDLEELTGASRLSGATAFGPSSLDAPWVVALAPFERQEGSYYVQIDVAAQRLSNHLDSLRRLTLLNAVVLGMLTLLVLLFLRHLLKPYDSLLESARRLEAGADETMDETQFLIQTFEKALQALAQRNEAETSDADEIAVLQRTLAPSLETGFMLLDRTGALLSINDLGANLLGIPTDSQGVRFEALLSNHPDLVSIVRDAVGHSSTVHRRECEIGPLEDRRVLGLSIHPLRRDDASTRGFIVLFTDLTQVQKQARQAEISRSLSQLGEIAAGVAHEMRNGLGTLKGYLTLIAHSPDDDTATDYLSEMRAETVHLERVLADFLSFARPGSLRTQTLDLAALIAKAAEDPTLGASDIRLVSMNGAFELCGDGQLLDRALRNLLQNAQEAQRSSGTTEPITVKLHRQGSAALIEIEDSGPGLPAHARDSLFQPFVSGRPDGVGLGLTLAHRIVELHGGELTIEDRPTRGARVSIRLPAGRGG